MATHRHGRGLRSPLSGIGTSRERGTVALRLSRLQDSFIRAIRAALWRL